MTERGQGMLVALGVILAIALVAGGVAVLARSGGDARRGTNGPDRLIGTPHGDTLRGRGGSDLIKGRGGKDLLSGGRAYDRIYGGAGSDRIKARDGRHDLIDCGAGKHDRAVVNRAEDGVFDCERVITKKTFQKRRGTG